MLVVTTNYDSDNDSGGDGVGGVVVVVKTKNFIVKYRKCVFLN